MISELTTYTITATNTAGSLDATVDITVNDIPPATVTYTPNAFVETKNTAMVSVTPTTTGGTVVSWSVDPALPSGLSLDTSTGKISGTPTVISESTTYTITTTNTAGSLDATVDITVNDIPPATVTYTPNAFVETKNTLMTSVTPTTTGGTVVSWSVDPALPMTFS